MICFFFFSSRRRHTRWPRDWSSDVCSSDLVGLARTGAAGVRLGTGRVLLIGGGTGGYGTSSVEQYDPAKGIWQNAAPLAYARYGHAAVLLPGGKVLVAGGRTSGG